MYTLTEARMKLVRPVLERYRQSLIETKAFEPGDLEKELKDVLATGYREVRSIILQVFNRHERYRYVAAFYMEHISANVVPFEFQDALAKAYGIQAYNSPELDDAAKAFWSRAPLE